MTRQINLIGAPNDKCQDVGPPPRSSPLCCWCQVVVWVFFEAGFGRTPVVVPGRRLVPGPGVAGPKSWRAGCEPAALDAESFPGCPPGPLARAAAAWRAVGLEAGEDGVADLALEGPERLFVRFSLGQLLLAVRAAFAVPVPDPVDRGHVDGVAVAAVAAQREPVNLAVPGGHLDGGGAVTGGEVTAAGEAGHVGDVAGDGAGDDRADAEDLGEVVPETLTAQAGFLRVPRSWASRRRMSPGNSAASSARASSTAPDGLTCARILAA